MANQCVVCEKKTTVVGKLIKLRGKYNPTIRKRKYPNLQWAYIPADTKKPAYREFAGKRIKICAKCIKALAKEK
ncbi:MAG: hypothetical protein ABH919_01530 [bacterium]